MMPRFAARVAVVSLQSSYTQSRYFSGRMIADGSLGRHIAFGEVIELLRHL